MGVNFRVSIIKTVGEDLVNNSILHPIGRFEIRVVDVNLETVIGGVFICGAPTAIEEAIVLVKILVGAVAHDEAVVEDGGLILRGQDGLPVIVAVGRIVAGGHPFQGAQALGLGSGAPHPDYHLADIIVVGAQAQGDWCAGGHRAAGDPVEVIPGVVAQAVPPDIIVVPGHRGDLLDFYVYAPGEGIHDESDVLIGCNGFEAGSGCVDTAPVRADGVPGPRADSLELVISRAGDSHNELVLAPAQGSHAGGRIGVIPTLPVTNGGPGTRFGADPDDVGLRLPAIAVGVAIEGDGDIFAIRAGLQPGIPGARVAGCPVLAGDLELVASGCGDRDQGGVDPITGAGIPMGAVIVQRVVRAPAVEVAPGVPVRGREEGKCRQGGEIPTPIGIAVGHIGVAGDCILGVAAAAGGEDFQGQAGRIPQRGFGDEVLDPVFIRVVALLAALGDQAVIAPTSAIPVVELHILEGVPILVIDIQAVFRQVSGNSRHSPAPGVGGGPGTIHLVCIQIDPVSHAPGRGGGVEADIVIVIVFDQVQSL